MTSFSAVISRRDRPPAGGAHEDSNRSVPTPQTNPWVWPSAVHAAAVMSVVLTAPRHPQLHVARHTAKPAEKCARSTDTR